MSVVAGREIRVGVGQQTAGGDRGRPARQRDDRHAPEPSIGIDGRVGRRGRAAEGRSRDAREQHHRNRENTIEICLLKVGGTSPITTRGAAQQKIILVLEPSNSATSGVKISELSERKIAAEVPSFELTPPSPDRRRMLARGN